MRSTSIDLKKPTEGRCFLSDFKYSSRNPFVDVDAFHGIGREELVASLYDAVCVEPVCDRDRQAHNVFSLDAFCRNRARQDRDHAYLANEAQRWT
ncbi:MAG: hypothetical protein AAAB11_02335 [Rhizobium giardinii]